MVDRAHRPDQLDLAPVLKHANIHFLGVRPFEQLPDYNRAFDVAIIPFVITRADGELEFR